MPLEHSSSPAALHRNIHTLFGEIGKSPHIQSRKQALAIAYSEKERAAAKRAVGGTVDPSAVVSGLVGVSGVNPSSSTTNINPATPRPFGVAPSAPPGAIPTPMLTAPNPASTQPMTAAAAQPLPINLPTPYQAPQQPARRDGGLVQKRAFGGIDMAKGPDLMPTWYERGAARGLMHPGGAGLGNVMGAQRQGLRDVRNLHWGPVASAVPGRTDAHHIKVPGGSFVLPADTISTMGHGNSLAGMKMASQIFPHSGSMRPPKFSYGGSADEGGARGHFDPVDVDVSGGEFIIHPADIIRRWGSLKLGHAVLDKFILDTRRKGIKTLKNLPGPAKK